MNEHHRRAPRLRTTLIIGALLAAAVPFALPAVPAVAGPAPRGAATMDALQLHAHWVVLWNDDRIDELGEVFYAEDAMVIPPNHEPIRGRANIVEYLKGVRNIIGDGEGGTDPFRAVTDGGLTSIVGRFVFNHGTMRFTSHEVYERQADGTVKCTVDMFGFRDPLGEEGKP